MDSTRYIKASVSSSSWLEHTVQLGKQWGEKAGCMQFLEEFEYLDKKLDFILHEVGRVLKRLICSGKYEGFGAGNRQRDWL